MARNIIIVLFVILLSSCQKTQDPGDTILKFYGDAYEDIGYSVAKVENDYVITGLLTEIKRSRDNYIDRSSKKFGIIRISSDGSVKWKRALGDTVTLGASVTGAALKVIALSDGSVICTGFVNGTDNQQDIFIVRLNGEGIVSSYKIFNLPGNQYGTDVLKTADGYLIAGTTDVARGSITEATGNAAGKKDILLLRTDNNFGLINSLPTGFLGNDEPVSIKDDINGGYIIAGTTDRSDKPSAEQGGNNVFLLRVNADINTGTDFRILGGVKNETFADFEILSDGYFIAGTSGNEAAEQRGCVWRLPVDIHAEALAQNIIDIEPGSNEKTAFSLKAMCRYRTSMFILAGQYGSGSSARMLIFASDENGNLIEGKIRIDGGTGTQVANDVISDVEEIVAVGKNTYENNSMISLLKFRF